MSPRSSRVVCRGIECADGVYADVFRSGSKAKNLLYYLETHTSMKLPNSPLLRQLLGAVAGTVAALVVYSAYEIVAPSLNASLTPPKSAGSSSSVYSNADRQGRQDQVVEMAKEALKNVTLN
jgi:hypothetical protein